MPALAELGREPSKLRFAEEGTATVAARTFN